MFSCCGARVVDGATRLKNAETGWCLEARSSWGSVVAGVRPCSEAAPQQLTVGSPDPGADVRAIQARSESGLCLDSPFSSYGRGATPTFYGCHGRAAQQWVVTEVEAVAKRQTAASSDRVVQMLR